MGRHRRRARYGHHRSQSLDKNLHNKNASDPSVLKAGGFTRLGLYFMFMVKPAIQDRTQKTTQVLADIESQIAQVIRGKAKAIRYCVAALLARGHILIEDIPGVGKTTLARALARSVGGSFHRIQFTSDLLPSDILGTTIFKRATESFEFKPGPIFANVVLADEINRTTPRTQSALLEVMSEGHVTIDDERRALPTPFLVVATQNPAENIGTYPLPESQLDRFLVRLHLGYPDRQSERSILKTRNSKDPVDSVSTVTDGPMLSSLQDLTEQVEVNERLVDYAMDIVESTRNHPSVEVGVSTRGSIAWYRFAQAMAMLEGRDFCIPDDFKHSALPCLSHRLRIQSLGAETGSLKSESERIIQDIVSKISVPV